MLGKKTWQDDSNKSFICDDTTIKHYIAKVL